MRVESVKIRNFKRFESLELDLGRMDCLVGANNTGKTTLLQALALFDFCVRHCLERKNGQLHLRKRTIAPEDFYVLPVTNPMDIWHGRRAMSGGKQRRVEVSALLDSGDRVTATVKLDFNRFGIAVDIDDDSPEAVARLTGLKISYLPVFSMFLPREERRLSAAIEDELARGRVNGVIRNLILELKREERDGELTKILRRSFPGLRDMQIQFDEVTDRYITVTYREEAYAKNFDIFSGGSGFQQFLYLFGFILLRNPTIIMLDEPDVHLHGSLQAVLLDELKRLVHHNKQVLFATHSRELIARVDPENILSLDDGARRLKIAFDVYDVMDRLGSLDPTQLVLIQAYRRIVIVEDRTDRDLLRIFCSKSLGTEIWQQVERRLAFCYSRGNPWKHHDMPRLRQLLRQATALEGAELELMVVADRDYHPNPEGLERSLPNEHIEWHVWRRTEIENYLLDTGVIARLVGAGEAQKTIQEDLLEKEFERLVEQSKVTANDRLVQVFEELRKREAKGWSAATMSRMAREFLEAHWENQRVDLADAKDVVLPGIKRWLQSGGFGQFSDKRLASEFERDELPDEIHEVAKRLAVFAGIASN